MSELTELTAVQLLDACRESDTDPVQVTRAPPWSRAGQDRPTPERGRNWPE